MNNKVLELHHWLIFTIIASGFSLYKFGFTWAALLSTRGILLAILVIVWIALEIGD